MGDVVSELEIRVNDLDDTDRNRIGHCPKAGPGYHTTTWSEENRALFRAMSLEKLVTAIFIGLITFVAGLNILVVLAMTVDGQSSRHRGANDAGRAPHAGAATFSCCKGSWSERRGRQ